MIRLEIVVMLFNDSLMASQFGAEKAYYFPGHSFLSGARRPVGEASQHAAGARPHVFFACAFCMSVSGKRLRNPVSDMQGHRVCSAVPGLRPRI